MHFDGYSLDLSVLADRKSLEKFLLTVKCWNSHARMMLVATLGKMPRFLFLFFSLSGSSSSPVLGEATLLSSPSPVKTDTQIYVHCQQNLFTSADSHKNKRSIHTVEIFLSTK